MVWKIVSLFFFCLSRIQLCHAICCPHLHTAFFTSEFCQNGRWICSSLSQSQNPSLFTWSEKIKTKQVRLITHYLGMNFRNELAWFQNTLVILWMDYSFSLGEKTNPNPPWRGLTLCVTFWNLVLSQNAQIHCSQITETSLSLDLGGEVTVWLWADTRLPETAEGCRLNTRSKAGFRSCSRSELWIQA